VNYLKLERTDDAQVKDVEMVVPNDYHVAAVTLSEGKVKDDNAHLTDSVTAGVAGTTDIDAADVMLPDGPGFASFTPSGSGQYILETSKGRMLATWAKAKLGDDGSSTYDYWQYMRKGKVVSKDITGPNWVIKEFGIKSYPASSNPAHHWVDWEPRIGEHSGDCKGSPVQLEVEYGGAAIATSFQDCDKYTAYMLDDKPGDFSVNWNPGFFAKWWGYAFGVTDPREIAFNWLVARKQPGTAAARGKFTVNDYQYFRMQSQLTGSTDTCDSTNTGTDC